mgnify:CR=1 FL=1
MNGLDDADRKAHETQCDLKPQWPQRGLKESEWCGILHANAVGVLGGFAAELYRAVPELLTRSPKQLGLRRREQVDLGSELYFVGLVRRVCEVLNVQKINLWIKRGSLESLSLLNTPSPALVVGEHSEMLRNVDQYALRFFVGRMLGYARPELYLARTFSQNSLRNMLLGFCAIYVRQLPKKVRYADIKKWMHVFEACLLYTSDAADE